jgi:hypothetical protein
MRTATISRTFGLQLRPGGPALLVALFAASWSCSDDAGAPATPWSLGAETQTALVTTAAATSGIVELRCPDGSVAIGFEGREGNLIDHVRLRCAELGSDGTLGAVSVTDTLGTSTSGTAFVTACPMDGGIATTLVGDRGNHNGHIHNIQGQCRRPADVAGGAVNGTATLTTALMGGGPFGDSQAYEVFCPNGSAVTGIRGRYETSSGYVAAIGYLCRAVMDG